MFITAVRLLSKKLESTNLRNALSSSIARFHKYIEGYREEPELGYDVIIKEEISRDSEFAAFKRKIVRDDIKLSATFGAFLV